MNVDFTPRCLLLFLLLLLNMPAKAQSGPPPTYSFYAYNEPYSYLGGSTTLTALTGQDDACQTSVPIGFNFLFAGTNYTTVSVNTNGWMSLNNYCYAYDNDNYYLPRLNSFGPSLLPLWEDINSAQGYLHYATTGTAPNRVFTLEYRNSVWDYTGSSPCISFQVRLYEGGVIKYHYKHESGTVVASTSNAGATIGIANTSSSYQVLNDFSTSPTTTSTTYGTAQYNNIVRPANGQVYQFGDFPCNAAPTPLLNNVTSTTANITWNAMLPSLNYEFALTSTATPPGSGTLSSQLFYNATNLTPNTQYYFHIRNICNSTQKTVWITIPVKTNPPCIYPGGYTVENLTVSSATIRWNGLKHAIAYQYLVDLDTNDPNSGSPYVTTTDTTFDIDQLNEGTTYYVHIRVLCPGGEYSDWSLDSFTTLITCRPPTLNVDYVNVDRAIVYWDPVRTAVEYEYEVSFSPTPLGHGTTIKANSFFAFPLKDGMNYYFHVRSKCVDQNTPTTSEWATTAFRTWPTTVNSVNDEGFAISAHPNPVNDILTVQFTELHGKGAITISDLNGRVINELPVTGLKMDISMSQMAPGSYFIKYTDEQHTRIIRVNKI